MVFYQREYVLQDMRVQRLLTGFVCEEYIEEAILLKVFLEHL